MELSIQTITPTIPLNLNVGNEIKFIGNYSNEVEALKVSEKKKPSVILLDYEIEKTNTELFIKSLLIESPYSRLILLGKDLSDEIIMSCLSCGIYGYLDWKDTEKFLNKAIHSVGCGEAWISRRLVALLIEKFRE